MSEMYDQYKAFAVHVEKARGELPTIVGEVTKIFEAIRENDPDITSSPVSEVFIPETDPDTQKKLVILRWGSRFKRTELGERAYQNSLHQLNTRTIYGSPMPALSTAIEDANFQYVVATAADDDIPYVTVAGLQDPTRVDAADFLGNPMGTLQRGLYLALRNPVRYSRSIVFSGSQATIQQEGFLCTPDGKLVEVGSTGLNFTHAWNIFDRENTYKPDQG